MRDARLLTAAIWVSALGFAIGACPVKEEPPAIEADTTAFLMTVVPPRSPLCPKPPCPGMQVQICHFSWIVDTASYFINDMPQIPACDSLFQRDFPGGQPRKGEP